MSKDKNFHNQGQTDFAQGDYDPPHGIVDDLTTWSSTAVQRLCEENKQYHDGWNHAKAQSKD
ncbi:hypothetical protein [Nitrosomonas sp.]|uniref:hypothetical protein n=1 Tax=Nitrosomonas sp. TaxID=42353 RepID=UPI0035B12C55